METNIISFGSISACKTLNAKIFSDKEISEILEEKNINEKCFEKMEIFKEFPDFFEIVNTKCKLVYDKNINVKMKQDFGIVLTPTNKLNFKPVKITEEKYKELYLVLFLFEKIIKISGYEAITSAQTQLKILNRQIDFYKKFLKMEDKENETNKS